MMNLKKLFILNMLLVNPSTETPNDNTTDKGFFANFKFKIEDKHNKLKNWFKDKTGHEKALYVVYIGGLGLVVCGSLKLIKTLFTPNQKVLIVNKTEGNIPKIINNTHDNNNNNPGNSTNNNNNVITLTVVK